MKTPRFSWISRFFESIKQEEEVWSRTRILETLLVGAIWTIGVALAIMLEKKFWDMSFDKRNSLSLLVIFFLWILMMFFYWLSKKGWSRLVSWLLLVVIIIFVTQMALKWGIDLPQLSLTYPIIITLGGILLGSKETWGIMLIVIGAMWGVFGLQSWGVITVENHWRQSSFSFVDMFNMMNAIVFLTIISWLSSREIFRSFKKAKELTEALKIERDNLEIQVQERTNELKEYQLRQLMKINTLAEFGKLSAGLLHDIKNPLSVISLNLDSLKDQTDKKELIDKTISAAKMVNATIKFSLSQVLRREEEAEEFEVNELINNTVSLVKHQADRHQAQILFEPKGKIGIIGYPVRLSQVVANLLMNAIEAEGKIINIKIFDEEQSLELEIGDNGIGMSLAIQKKIFEPLFSTKKNEERSGLGLYISQKIIHDYFHGQIKLISQRGVGSTFIIKLPKENGKSRR